MCRLHHHHATAVLATLAAMTGTSLAFVPTHTALATSTAAGKTSSENRQLFTLLHESKEETTSEPSLNVVDERSDQKKKYVVVGGGWGGWGAAKALCESGMDVDVTLIDALPDPTGVSVFFSVGCSSVVPYLVCTERSMSY